MTTTTQHLLLDDRQLDFRVGVDSARSTDLDATALVETATGRVVAIITRRPGPATIRLAVVELARRAQVHFERGHERRGFRAIKASRRLSARAAALRAA